YVARECRDPRGSPSTHIARKVLPDGLPLQSSAELADRGLELEPAPRLAAGPLLGARSGGVELLGGRRPAVRRSGAGGAGPQIGYVARECRDPRGSPSTHIARKVLPDGLPLQSSAELADRGLELEPAPRLAAGPLLGARSGGVELLGGRRPAVRRSGAGGAGP